MAMKPSAANCRDPADPVEARTLLDDDHQGPFPALGYATKRHFPSRRYEISTHSCGGETAPAQLGSRSPGGIVTWRMRTHPGGRSRRGNDTNRNERDLLAMLPISPVYNRDDPETVGVPPRATKSSACSRFSTPRPSPHLGMSSPWSVMYCSARSACPASPAGCGRAGFEPSHTVDHVAHQVVPVQSLRNTMSKAVVVPPLVSPDVEVLVVRPPYVSRWISHG